jgi:hypothetical protein
MSVANQQAAKFIIDNLQEKADEQQREMMGGEPDEDAPQGRLCLAKDPKKQARFCVHPVSHRGRHRYGNITSGLLN